MNEPAPKLPKTLQDWREAKADAAKDTFAEFHDSIELVELSLSYMTELFNSVMPLSVKESRVFLVYMLTATQRLLLNALDLLLERQHTEYLAILRPAVEMAADAAKIGRDPNLAICWMNRDVDEAAYNKAFKPQFPRGDPLTGPLFIAYNMTTEIGTHSNASLFLFHIERDKNSLRDNVSHFLVDSRQLRWFMVHLVAVAERILRVYAEGLKPIAKVDFTVKLGILHNAVAGHCAKYRSIFESKTDKDSSSDPKA